MISFVITLANIKNIGELIVLYSIWLFVLFILFRDVYITDKLYTQNKLHTNYFKFKHKWFFIIQYDRKNKNIVAKQTFFMLLGCYLLLFLAIGLFIGSLFVTGKMVLIFFYIEAFAVCIYGVSTCSIYYNGKKKIYKKTNNQSK